MNSTQQTSADTEYHLELRNNTLHTKNCLQRRALSNTRIKSIPTEQDDNDHTECQFCSHDITTYPELLAPVAGLIASKVPTIQTHGSKFERPIHDHLRTLIRIAKNRIQSHQYLPERTGISVKSVRHWQQQRNNTNDTTTFDKIVMDGLEVSLIFDIVYYHFEAGTPATTWEDAIELQSSEEIGMGPEKNVANSIKWLQKHREPQAKTLVTEALETYHNAQKQTNSDIDTDDKSDIEGSSTESTEKQMDITSF